VRAPSGCCSAVVLLFPHMWRAASNSSLLILRLLHRVNGLSNTANDLSIEYSTLFLIVAMILHHRVLVAVDRVLTSQQTRVLQECADGGSFDDRPVSLAKTAKQFPPFTLRQAWQAKPGVGTFNDPTSFLCQSPASPYVLLFLSASIRLFFSQSFQQTHLLELSPTTLL